MKVGKTFYAKTRKAWRAWLARHHQSAREIWLIYYKKHSGKPRTPYNDAVEEALCFGWIDSILKPMDDVRWAQRFSPRRPTSRLSEMNRERVRRLIAARRMTKAGLERVKHVFDRGTDTKRLKWTVPKDILRRLQRDPTIWRNFSRFPESYRRIRIGWIVAARHRAEVFERRLTLPQDDCKEQAVRHGAVTAAIGYGLLTHLSAIRSIARTRRFASVRR